MREYMPTKNACETIEILARKLERSRILNDLYQCETLEDLEEIKEKYKKLCESDDLKL